MIKLQGWCGAKRRTNPGFINHAIGYPVQPEVYGQKVIDFFNETLK